MAIRIRRGNQVDFDANKLVAGELGLVLDRGELYFCYSPGNTKKLQTAEDLQNLLDASPEAYQALQQLIADLKADTSELVNILNNITNLQENKLGKTDDTKDNTVTFSEADEDKDIQSGEKHSTLFGKIKKSIKTLRYNIGLLTSEKLDITKIVQTDTINDPERVPSSAVTHALGLEIDQLNNKLVAQTIDLSTILTAQNPKHTIQYAQATKYGNLITLAIRVATDDKFTSAEAASFVLPAEYRPPIPIRIPCMLHNNPIGNPAFGYTDIGYCVIDPDGNFTIRNYNGSTATFALVSVAYIAA